MHDKSAGHRHLRGGRRISAKARRALAEGLLPVQLQGSWWEEEAEEEGREWREFNDWVVYRRDKRASGAGLAFLAAWASAIAVLCMLCTDAPGTLM